MQSLHPKRMMVIVAEPKTGKILAMSGRMRGINLNTDDPIAKIDEPASTFMPVVVVAALQEGRACPKRADFSEGVKSGGIFVS
jgi:cell division protein FtsI/penicillin-binding protein 2